MAESPFIWIDHEAYTPMRNRWANTHFTYWTNPAHGNLWTAIFATVIFSVVVSIERSVTWEDERFLVSCLLIIEAYWAVIILGQLRSVLGSPWTLLTPYGRETNIAVALQWSLVVGVALPLYGATQIGIPGHAPGIFSIGMLSFALSLFFGMALRGLHLFLVFPFVYFWDLGWERICAHLLNAPPALHFLCVMLASSVVAISYWKLLRYPACQPFFHRPFLWISSFADWRSWFVRSFLASLEWLRLPASLRKQSRLSLPNTDGLFADAYRFKTGATYSASPSLFAAGTLLYLFLTGSSSDAGPHVFFTVPVLAFASSGCVSHCIHTRAKFLAWESLRGRGRKQFVRAIFLSIAWIQLEYFAAIILGLAVIHFALGWPMGAFGEHLMWRMAISGSLAISSSGMLTFRSPIIESSSLQWSTIVVSVALIVIISASDIGQALFQSPWTPLLLVAWSAIATTFAYRRMLTMDLDFK